GKYCESTPTRALPIRETGAQGNLSLPPNQLNVISDPTHDLAKRCTLAVVPQLVSLRSATEERCGWASMSFWRKCSNCSSVRGGCHIVPSSAASPSMTNTWRI